jgi:hypothetical protein
MHAEDYRQAHGKSGVTITDDGVETAAMVYVAPELRLDPCPECGGGCGSSVASIRLTASRSELTRSRSVSDAASAC